MNRRQALRGGAALGSLAVAGCLGLFETESVWRNAPLVEDRPDAVYLPAGVEEMATYGTAQVGEYAVALQYTFPHRFWTVTGTSTSRVEVTDSDALHLMLTVWDADSGVVLPIEPQLELRRDGSIVDSRTLWSMLSQRMGFHYGDNVAIEEGSYVASVTLPPVDARPVGDLDGAFEDSAQVELEFSYDADDVYDLEYSQFEEERRGARDAVPLMAPAGEDGPVLTVPEPAALPGESLGTGESGDAVFAASLVPSGSRFADEGQYLLVSPRTPYNAVPIPQMELSATITRDDGAETVYDGRLPVAVDHDVGIHYGDGVGSLRSGDRVEVSIDAPPQVSRHDGYETAFFEMPSVEFTVGG